MAKRLTTGEKREKALIDIINKMFEIAGHEVTFDDVKGRKDEWYKEWTMTIEQSDEWTLEPGDMLYLPPRLAHCGTAEDDCMTYSIGFRAPSHADIIAEAGQEIALSIVDDLRYADPDLTLQDNPGEINDKAIEQVRNIILQHLTNENIAHWFGKFMTERKYLEHTDEEPLDIDADEWQSALADGELLWRHPSARPPR